VSQQPTPPLQPEVPTGLVLYQAQVDANAAARQSITDQVFAQVAALLQAFNQWYDDLAVRRLARQITDVVQAGQNVIAAHEDAYMSSVLSAQSGQTVKPVGQVVVDDLRNGVDPVQVYERLGEQFRYSRSIGGDEGQALRATLDRAEIMTDTDVTLAARAQDQKNLQAATHLAVAYRRVIHPELAKGGTCGMCIAASDRRYKIGTLLPIHARCHCTVAPIFHRGEDPGSSLNNLSLDQLYKDAGGTQATNLKRTRYQIDDHGELGPVLQPASSYLSKVSDEALQARIDDWEKRPGSRFRSAHLNELLREQRNRDRAAKRAKRRGSVVPENAPTTSGAGKGLSDVSDEFLSRQLRITEGLKDSPYRTKQLARLRAEIKRRAKK